MELCEGHATFKEWYIRDVTSADISYSYACKLLKVGQADDPEEALEILFLKNKKNDVITDEDKIGQDTLPSGAAPLEGSENDDEYSDSDSQEHVEQKTKELIYALYEYSDEDEFEPIIYTIEALMNEFEIDIEDLIDIDDED